MFKLRGVVILIGMLLIATNTFSQKYYYSPIEIADILKGWEDPDYFKAVLMEKGFVCNDLYSKTENWRVPYKNEKDLIYILINEWKISENLTQKRLTISIRKDLMPKYIADFKNAIIKYFPTKEVNRSKGERTQGGVTKKYNTYVLRYTKEGTTITIDYSTLKAFDINDVDVDEFVFMYDIIK